MHAKLINGGGPHMPTKESLPAAGMFFWSMSASMNPTENFQSSGLCALRQPVHSIPDFHPIGEITRPPIEVLSQQNVRRRLVGIDEVELRCVPRVPERLFHHLVRWCDTRPAADEPEVLHSPRVLVDLNLPVAQVCEVPDRSLDLDGVAYCQAVQVLRHLAAVREPGVHVFKVHLDHQVEEAHLVVAGGGSVGTHHWRTCVCASMGRVSG